MTSGEYQIGVEPAYIWGRESGPGNLLQLEMAQEKFHGVFADWCARGVITEHQANRELQELKQEFFRAYNQLQVVVQKWIFEW